MFSLKICKINSNYYLSYACCYAEIGPPYKIVPGGPISANSNFNAEIDPPLKK